VKRFIVFVCSILIGNVNIWLALDLIWTNVWFLCIRGKLNIFLTSFLLFVQSCM